MGNLNTILKHGRSGAKNVSETYHLKPYEKPILIHRKSNPYLNTQPVVPQIYSLS